ncbi:MAG: YdbL family protein [Rhodospirillales bacterium]|nr:YdbL family protein [Rhodospirillales bacterium]
MTRLPFASFFVLIALLAMPFRPAFAVDLVTAKAQGLVGERPDGLIGIVSPPGAPDVQALVKTINDERLSTYSAIAQEQNTTPEKVQAVAGASLISKTPSGQFIMAPDGVWKKAP